MFRALALGSLLLSLTACGVSAKKNPCQLKQEGKAIVLGQNASILMEPVNMLINRGDIDLQFVGADGKKIDGAWLSSGADSIELSPGSHTVDLYCAGYYRDIYHADKITGYRLDVKAGHIYRMKALGSFTGKCNVTHADITEKFSGHCPDVQPASKSDGDRQ